MKIRINETGAMDMDYEALQTLYEMDPKEVRFVEALAKEAANYLCCFEKTRIKEVIFHGPATIVYWSDETKTVVKCMDGDTMNYETGIAMCMLKKIFGSSYTEFKKYLREIDPNKKENSNDKRRETEGTNGNAGD